MRVPQESNLSGIAALNSYIYSSKIKINALTNLMIQIDRVTYKNPNFSNTLKEHIIEMKIISRKSNKIEIENHVEDCMLSNKTPNLKKSMFVGYLMGFNENNIKPNIYKIAQDFAND